MSDPIVSKRLVLQHTQGPFKGLEQIVGIAEDVPEFLAQLVVFERLVDFASLVKVAPRFVLYREVAPKPRGRFGQVMEGFDPNQR